MVLHIVSVKALPLSFILPLDEVKRRGIEPEAAVLQKYLQADTSESTLQLASTSDSLRDPWQLNSMIALALGDLKTSDAAPLLQQLIAEPIPRKLDAALTAFAASEIAWDAKPFDWEKRRRDALIQFRGDCAFALATIGDTSSVPGLEAYVDSQIPMLQSWWGTNQEISRDAIWGFVSTCKALSILGSKHGIDALITALPHVKPHNPDLVTHLRIITGETFGPEFGMPAREYPKEVKKWSEWWKSNRAAFTVRAGLLEQRIPPYRRLSTDTLAESLEIAHRRLSDFEGNSGGKGAAAWLEQFGNQHLDELAQIIADPAANYNARREAIEWYAKFAGSEAIPLLTQCMTLDIPHDPADVPLLEHLAYAARDAIKKNLSGELPRIARVCWESKSDAIVMLARDAVKDANAADAIAKRFPECTSATQLSLVQSMSDAPRGPALSVFTQAVRQTSDAWVALYGVRGIHSLQADQELNSDTKTAIVFWERDPFFRLLTIWSPNEDSSSPHTDSLRQIAADAGGKPNASLRIHYMLYQLASRFAVNENVTQADKEQFVALRAELWQAFCQDVASQGRNDLLDCPVPPLRSPLSS